MTDAATRPARPLQPAALRGVKALATWTLGSTAVAALGIGAGYVLGHAPGVLPALGIGAVWAFHYLRERLEAIVVGRGRLGIPDRLARTLAREAQAVARRDPDGAWVVLSRDGRKVEVLDSRGFEELAGVVARQGQVLKVVRAEGAGIVVERYEAGVLRDPDGPGAGGDAVETFDRRGRLVDSRSVDAPIPQGLSPPGVRVDDDAASPPAEVSGRRLPEFGKPGSDLARTVDEAIARGSVHVRKGMAWLAYLAADAQPGAVPDRAHQRMRRTEPDLVEIIRTWEGVQVTRSTFGRLDSAAHGTPARLTFDPDGRATRTEWFVEGRPAEEDEALEAHAGYRAAPVAG